MIVSISLFNHLIETNPIQATEEDIAIDMILDVIAELIEENEQKHLTNTQIHIFKSLCRNKPATYEEIAERLNMSEQGVTAAGIGMYKILNNILETRGKINKKNFHSTAIPAIYNLVRERIKIKTLEPSNSFKVNNLEQKVTLTPPQVLNSRSINLQTIDKPETEKQMPSLEEDLNNNISTQIILESANIPLDLSSKFYVARKEDKVALKYIEQPRAIIRLQGKRKSGATSLIGRLTHHAQDLSGDKVVLINFKSIEPNSIKSSQSLIKWIVQEIEDQLGITDCIEEIWKDSRAKASAKKYFLRYLLKELSSSLIIIFDRLDIIFDPQKAESKEIKAAQTLFSEVRTWIDASSTNDLWLKIKYIIVEGENEIDMPSGVSPFNLGRRIVLNNFSQEEIIDLAKRHGLNWSKDELNCLQTKLEDNFGHPQLTRLILNYTIENKLSFDRLLKIDFEATKPFQECINLLKG